MGDFNLSAVDLSLARHVLYICQRDDDSSITSWIDHVLCNSLFTDCVSEVKRLNFGFNLSDHIPVALICNRVFNNFCTTSEVHSRRSTPVCAWSRANPSALEAYRTAVSSSLTVLSPNVLSCCDMNCTRNRSSLDHFCHQLTDSLVKSTQLTVPLFRSSTHHTAGWNDKAHVLKRDANFWYKVWLEAGCPSFGVLFQIKKNSNNRFKYEVRILQRQELHIRRKKMAEALLSSRTRDF